MYFLTHSIFFWYQCNLCAMKRTHLNVQFIEFWQKYTQSRSIMVPWLHKIPPCPFLFLILFLKQFQTYRKVARIVQITFYPKPFEIKLQDRLPITLNMLWVIPKCKVVFLQNHNTTIKIKITISNLHTPLTFCQFSQ